MTLEMIVWPCLCRTKKKPRITCASDSGLGGCMKTHLDLFSGIGGFALAAKWAGFETVAFCSKQVFFWRKT